MSDDLETRDKRLDLERMFRLPARPVPSPSEILANCGRDRMRSPEEIAAGYKPPVPEPPPAAEQAPEAGPETPDSLDQLAPLPRTGDPYKAHARLANRPLATIFFLPKGQLPDGFSYASLERVRLIDSEKPGGGPALLLRFNGSVVTEMLIEGRNLLALCDLIGRHLIHWVREHPTGRDDGDSRAVFIRRITVREIEPDR